MKPSSLYTLIQSLTPAEKGYFKKYVQHDNAKAKSYVRLFDAINSQEEYDEDKLKKKFAKELSNFSAAKNYLFESILASLKVTHQQHDVFAQTVDYLTSADILAARQLFELASGYLEKAHQFAEKNSEPALHLLAFDRLLMMASAQYDREALIQLTGKGMEQVSGWLEDMKANVLVRQAITWLTLYRLLYSGPSTAEERLEFLSRAKKFAATLSSIRLSPQQLYSLQQMQYVICEAEGDIDGGFHHLNMMIQNIQSSKDKSQITETNMVVAIWNIGCYCLRHRPAEVIIYVRKLEDLLARTNQPAMKIVVAMAKRFRYMLLLLHYNDTGNTTDARKLVQEINIWFQDNEKFIPLRVISKLSYELAIHYFSLKDYRQALVYLTRLNDNPETDRNTLLAGLVLEMMIQYESGDAEYIQRLVKPLFKELKTYKMSDSFYQLAYDCFLRIVHNPDPRHVVKQLDQLLSVIESYSTYELNRSPALMKVLLPWLQSKRDKSSFIEAVRKISAKRVS